MNDLAWLGDGGLNDFDESRYGVSAYEMARSGDWIRTTYAGQPEYWNLKPAFGYWLIAASMRALGPSPWSLRLPSALAGIAAVALTLRAHRHLGRVRALLAAAVLATAPAFTLTHGARTGDLETMLACAFLVAMLAGRHARRAGAGVLVGAALGIGFLIKSFAVAPMAAALAAMWVVDQRARPTARSFAAAGAVFAAVVLGWGWWRCAADGDTAFVRAMVDEDLFGRCLRQLDRRPYSPTFYLASMNSRWMPWSGAVIAAGAALAWVHRRRWRELAAAWRRHRALALWAGVPVAILSLCHTQYPWYVTAYAPAFAGAIAVVTTAALRALRLRWCGIGMLLALLALSEARMIRCVRNILADPRDRDLAAAAAMRGPSVVTRPLRHRERFVLECVLGLEVVEDAAGTWPPMPRDYP